MRQHFLANHQIKWSVISISSLCEIKWSDLPLVLFSGHGCSWLDSPRKYMGNKVLDGSAADEISIQVPPIGSWTFTTTSVDHFLFHCGFLFQHHKEPFESVHTGAQGIVGIVNRPIINTCMVERTISFQLRLTWAMCVKVLIYKINMK